MALNPGIYIHGILYCAEYLRRSPLSIPEKCLIGLMLDFSDADPGELISVIEISYNHNLPALVQEMNLDHLAKVYSKMSLYGLYRSDLLFIWFRIYSLHLEKVSGKSQAPLLQMSDKKVFAEWMDTHLQVRTSKFFEQKSNRDWLTKQIRYIWKKNSLEEDLNAEAFLRSELYFVLENEEDTENIDSFLDISFNYRVPQNVLSQDRSFRTQLEQRLSLLGGMATTCIEIWSRALLTFEEAEKFLASASLKPETPRIQKSSPPPAPKPSSASKPSQTKSAPRTKTAPKKPAWNQPTVQQPPQPTSPSVPAQNKKSGFPLGCWLLAFALLIGLIASGFTQFSKNQQSESVNPTPQVAPKSDVRTESSGDQSTTISSPKTVEKVELPPQELQVTEAPEQDMELSTATLSTSSQSKEELRLPESVASEESTESMQDLKNSVCQTFALVLRKVIDDCRLKWRGEGPEFFIISFRPSGPMGVISITDIEFDPPPKNKRRTKNCLNGYDRKRFHNLFNANEAKYIQDKHALQCKM